MNTVRRGFTLVEMLVVIFIIAILAALVLPAIQRARVRGRQTACMNNIRNLGVAIGQFADNDGQFPAAGYWDAATASVPMRSWIVDVLPYLGEQKLHDKWDKDEPFDDAIQSNNLALSETRLDFLVCPADGRARLSYVLNGGFGFSSGKDCPTAFHADGWVWMDFDGDGSPCSRRDRELMKETGVFFLQKWPKSGPIRFHSPATVRDGLSNTIMLSENIAVGVEGKQTSWANAWVANCQFFASGHICPSGDCSQVMYENANKQDDALVGREAINASRKLAPGSPWVSSYHGSGVNIAFCDGSARFLSEDISGSVFAKLITPNGSWLPLPLKQSPLDAAEF